MEAAQLRRQDDADRDLAVAWHIEALHRQKKLPSLTTLLKNGRRTGKKQSVAEMRSALGVLAAQYGIPLRRGRGKTRG